MKNVFKRYRTVILLIGIAVIAIFVFWKLDFVAVRSGTRIGYIGKEGWSSWSASYVSLDGRMRKSIHPKGDVVHVEVKTEAGTISIEMKDTHGDVIFKQDNIETSSFDVKVSGKVTIRIEADHHRGSFDIGG